jgi:hypothetical protein
VRRTAGIDDRSVHSTSERGESAKTDEELSTRKLPVKLSTKKLPIRKPSGRKQSRSKANLKIPLADTGGRGAGLVSANTSATFVAQAGGSTVTADMPMACLSQTETPSVVQEAPSPLDCMAGMPEDVTATEIPKSMQMTWHASLMAWQARQKKLQSQQTMQMTRQASLMAWKAHQKKLQLQQPMQMTGQASQMAWQERQKMLQPQQPKQMT